MNELIEKLEKEREWIFKELQFNISLYKDVKDLWTARLYWEITERLLLEIEFLDKMILKLNNLWYGKYCKSN